MFKYISNYRVIQAKNTFQHIKNSGLKKKEYNMNIMQEVKIQNLPYGGWANCVLITNGLVDLIVTIDVGPRIIRYGFSGQENELSEIKEEMGLTGGNEWRMYGGHRLWHSPEARHRTYEPDNVPVVWGKIHHGIKTSQETETRSGIKKEMEITLSPESSRVSILHRLINKGPWPVELSAWSISAMAPGGKEVVPQACQDTGLLPNRLIALWPYTQMNDSRIQWGNRYIVVHHDDRIRHPVKFGIPNEQGWAAYFNRNHLFLKYYTHRTNVRYPDFGASFETYANDIMLEMETLSPLVVLEPEANLLHEEQWELFDNVSSPLNDENEIEKILKHRLNPMKRPQSF
jgi:hypothetical protein